MNAASSRDSEVSAPRIALFGHLRRAALATAFLMSAALPRAAAADGVDAVTTPGSGELTMCRSWVVYDSCDAHKVVLPERIAVGDKIKLTYGSNPKSYVFHVVQIRREDKGCTILSAASGGREDGEKLAVAQCQETAKPASQGR